MLIQEELISLQRNFLAVIEEAKRLVAIFPTEAAYPTIIASLHECSKVLKIDLNVSSQIVNVCYCLAEILQMRDWCMSRSEFKRVGQKLDEFITGHVPFIFQLANLNNSLCLKKLLKEWYVKIFNGFLAEEQKYNDEIRVLSRLLSAPERTLELIEDITDAGSFNLIELKLEEINKLCQKPPLSEEAQMEIKTFSCEVQDFVSRICDLASTSIFYEGGIAVNSDGERMAPISDEEFLSMVAHWSKQQADMMALQREIARLSNVCSGLVMRKNSVIRVFGTIDGLIQKIKWPTLYKSVDDLIRRITAIKLTVSFIRMAVQEWRATKHAGMPLDMAASSVGAILPGGAATVSVCSLSNTSHTAIKRST